MRLSDRPMYYRRNGQPYPGDAVLTWSRDFESFGERVVDETWTPWGDRVSTVWLGLDHAFFGTRPLIFETMTFDRDGEEISCDRYATELEELDGHRSAYFRALVPPFIVHFLRKHFGAAD